MQGCKSEGKVFDLRGQDFPPDRYFSAKLIMIVLEEKHTPESLKASMMMAREMI